MSALASLRRIPGHRMLVVATVTALATAGMSLAPDEGGATASHMAGPCALGGGDGFGEGPTGAEFLRPRGHHKAVMIMVDFPDIPARDEAKERAAFFSGYNDRYLRRASYGRYTLQLLPTDGWVRMPQPWSAYGIRRGMGADAMRRYVQDAVDAARAQGTDFAGTDFVYVVADGNVPVPPTVSQANTFEGLTAGAHRLHGAALIFGRRQDSPDWQRGNFVHEANHLYGLPDLYDVEHDASVEYAGGWDTMSMAGISDLLGWHKWKLGWLSRRQVQCVHRPGTSTHWLRPIGSQDGADITVVRTGAHTALVAEARTRTGLDADLCAQGVLLYQVNASVPTGHGPVRVVDAHPGSHGGPDCSTRSPAELAELGDAPFTPGEEHTFPGGVRVRVLGTQAGRYRIRVTVPPEWSGPG
jgi:M6 family metalloprotease-like protein